MIKPVKFTVINTARSRHEAFIKWWLNVGPLFATLDQYYLLTIVCPLVTFLHHICHVPNNKLVFDIELFFVQMKPYNSSHHTSITMFN